MKALIVVFALLYSVAGWCAYPQADDEYVNDFAAVMEPELESELRSKLKDVEYYSGVEIVLVTIDSWPDYQTGHNSWEGFATGLFNDWRIGNLPKNDGVLIMLAVDDRKIRIELGAGYPGRYDRVMKRIIDDVMVPALKQNAYSDVIELGAYAVIDAVTVPVSFFQWYRYHILAGFLAIMSTLIALYAERNGKHGLFWVFLSLGGFIVLGMLRDLREGNGSDGFGGGSSSGGGASGGD